ncbi:zinc finger BED domain-containing protein 1-like [Drosophila busckii]|uniref:zinc finger BED domain-containing protein 1-like n=1 Tax=Drosophila busckii TaxID=30019 RepID=UPI00083EEBAD|nr:zinc finger BED domain-containing protein 1-like [Drosophila busckii]
MVMRMISKDVQPFSVVEDSGFKDLITKLDPRYKLPSPAHLRNVVLPAQYEELRKKVKMDLSDVDDLAITADCWTSRANDGYLTVTCHFINTNFDMKCAVLSTKKLLTATNHTAANIAESLSSVFECWDIRKKVRIIVTDNDASMKKACELLEIKHLPCVAHTLNLLVQELLKADSLIPLMSKCKKIVAFFKSSTIATEKLKEAQGTNESYSLIQEVPTRWNSAYLMIERIILIKEAIASVLLISSKAPIPLFADEVAVLEDVCRILAPFNEATKQVSANKSATISLVIPIICELHQKLDVLGSLVTTKIALDLCGILKERMPARLAPYQSRTVTRIATIIDPRFKKLGFLSLSNADQAAKGLEMEIQSQIRSHVPPQIPTPPATPLRTENTKPMFTFLQNRMSEQVHSSRADTIILLRQYLEKKNEPEDTDPVLFWRNNTDLNALQNVAKKFLCVPATSAESERNFSKAGQIISDRRCSLKPNIVDMILFLNKNQI